jgi:L-amino acid N-acyltransferase YncA
MQAPTPDAVTPVVGLVRDTVPERDAAACLEIYAPFVRDTIVSFEEQVPTVPEFKERMESSTRTHPWLVYEQAAAVVGYAYASQHRARAAYRWATDVSVYVAPTHHGRGIGRRLYTELFERLRHQGFLRACAGIALPNPSSVGLHEAMGFKLVGVYPRIGWKLGAWHDVGWWQLDLAPASDQQPAELKPNSVTADG